MIMAYLTPSDYDRRRENAAKRQSQNSEIAQKNGLTEEQTDLIEEIARFRHDIHCSGDSLYVSESGSGQALWDWLNSISERVSEAKLHKIELDIEAFPDDNDRAYGLIEDTAEEETANLQKFHERKEELNTQMEKWLRYVDETHGTAYAPTGMQRLP